MNNEQNTSTSREFDLKGFKLIDDWFGSTGCLGQQAPVIRATLSGDDVYAIMPARSGKSLCYQLPARLDSESGRGTTIIISPFPSQFKDRQEELIGRDVYASFLDSQSNPTERAALLMAILTNYQIDILYMTPEQALRSDTAADIFEILSESGQLARIVIDNANYVSLLLESSGLDPSALKRKFPKTPILCLSDSPSRRCREKLLQKLGLDPAKFIIFATGLEIPSVMYQVVDKDDKVGDMVKRINENFNGQTGIIYCRTRSETEVIAEELRENGINAAHYHAQRPDKEAVLEEWERDRVSVLVTTCAFRSRSSCSPRFVFHHSIPLSLETYFRETSKDAFNLPNRPDLSTCSVLYYSEEDVERKRCLIQSGTPDPDEDHGYRDTVCNRPRTLQNETEAHTELHTSDKEKADRFQLNQFIQMVRYANEKVKCRKTILYQHYGCEDAPERCLEYLCDNCENNFDCPEPTQIDVSRYASYALRLIEDSVRSGRRLTKKQVAQCLACLDNESLRKKNALTLHSYGLLARKSMQTILWILSALETRYIIGGDPVKDPKDGEYVHMKILSPSFANAIHHRHIKIRLPAFQVTDNPDAELNHVSVLDLDFISTEDMVRMVEEDEDESSVSSEESFIPLVPFQPGPSMLSLASVKQELLDEEHVDKELSKVICPETPIIPAKRVEPTSTEPARKRRKH